jgi:hypothetical protein
MLCMVRPMLIPSEDEGLHLPLVHVSLAVIARSRTLSTSTEYCSTDSSDRSVFTT